ncbi:hypothetical protein [Microtetraspora glauca]|uniref:Transcriptional regulator n=1 Tax=Microtetraspora glauca TaxID=1996 RepID=A0ABV3GAS4_MICGL
MWDYLQRKKAQEGDSLRALAKRCVDPETGFDLKRPWLSMLAEGDMNRAPELWRLRALAAGMSAPLQQLQLMAAQQWLGFSAETVDVQVGSGDHVIVPVPPGLTAADRAKVVRWAEQWARELDEED